MPFSIGRLAVAQYLDVLLGDGQPWGDTIYDAAYAQPMGLSEGCYPERVAKGITTSTDA